MSPMHASFSSSIWRRDGWGWGARRGSLSLTDRWRRRRGGPPTATFRGGHRTHAQAHQPPARATHAPAPPAHPALEIIHRHYCLLQAAANCKCKCVRSVLQVRWAPRMHDRQLHEHERDRRRQPRACIMQGDEIRDVISGTVTPSWPGRCVLCLEWRQLGEQAVMALTAQ